MAGVLLFSESCIETETAEPVKSEARLAIRGGVCYSLKVASE